MLLCYQPRMAACAIYLRVVAFGAVLLSGFWSVINECFDPRSAKNFLDELAGSGLWAAQP